MERKHAQSAVLLAVAVAVILVAFVVTYIVVMCFADGGDADGAVSAAVEDSDASGRYIFLVAGRDEVSGLTDVLLLVSFDADVGEVCVLQLPRDTYFNCTRRSYKKLNGATSALGGLRALADELEMVLGVRIDHTVDLTLDTFSQLVDLIGGVPINVPYDMDYEDESQGLSIHLRAGEHRLCGDEAVQFVRFRSGYVQGDIGRIDAQKLFLAALARQVTENVGPLRLPAIVGAALGRVKTDMNLATAISIARAALRLELDKIVMLTLPGADARTGGNRGAWYYVMNRRATGEVMTNYFGVDGEWLLDAERRFTNPAYPHFEKIYDADDIAYSEHRADGINQNGIGIDLAG